MKTQEQALYVYCVAPWQEEYRLGSIGIESQEVYTLPYKDVCALVHNCPPQPYSSTDEEVVRAWALAHEGVVEAAWEKRGSVLPFSFNTIIQDEANSPSQALLQWLEREYPNLKRKLDHLRGKAEYGVQIFWDPAKFVASIEEACPGTRALREELTSQPRGLAYMNRQKLEKMLRQGVETKAQELFRELYQQLRPHSDSLRLEKPRGGSMLVNLSCLVARERHSALAQELDRINGMEGLRVHFTGPWPPYSFC